MLTKQTLDQKYQIDILAEQAGGYCAAPSEWEMEYTDLLFSICAEHGIRYYSATKTERCFVEELARKAWEEREDERVEL